MESLSVTFDLLASPTAGLCIAVGILCESKDLVEANGAGTIFEAGLLQSPRDMHSELIENPNRVAAMQGKALSCLSWISGELIARYLGGAVLEISGLRLEAPAPPWI